MTQAKLFLIVITLIMMAGVAWGACVTPYEDLAIAADTVLCTGTYYLNDSAQNGSIAFTGDGAELNCNGSTFIGNKSIGSRAISSSRLDNVIHNCTFKFYDYGIRLSTRINVTVYDVNIYNSSIYGLYNIYSDHNKYYNLDIQNTSASGAGIYIYGTNGTIISNSTFSKNNGNDILGRYNNNNSQIHGNTIYSSCITSLCRSIYFYEDGNNNSIYDNFINGSYDTLRIQASVGTTLIQNNTVVNSKHWGIAFDADNTRVLDNTVINSSWNLIYIGGNHSNVSNNWLANYIHHGIDAHNSDFILGTKNSSITGNYITQTSDEYTSGYGSIFIQASANNTIENNTINNVHNATLPYGYSLGINIEGNVSSGNIVRGNTLTDVDGFCLYDTALDTQYINNYLGCDYGATAFKLSYHDNWVQASFTDNTIPKSNLLYDIATTKTNVTINETGLAIDVNTQNSAFIYANYAGRKDIRVLNNSVVWNAKGADQTKALSASETFYITKENCITPIANTSYTIDTYLCGNTNKYQLTGNMIINGGILLDCAGATVQGNPGMGVNGILYTYDDQNWTLNNCTLDSRNNSRYTVLVQLGRNGSIINNNISGASQVGIEIQGLNDSNISRNNIGDKCYRGMQFHDGILYNVRNILVSHNTFYSGWTTDNDDAADFVEDGFKIVAGDSNIIEYNTFRDWGHASFYITGNDATFTSNNNTFRHNIIYDTVTTYNRGFGIDGKLGFASNNTFYNITVINTTIRNQLNGDHNYFYDITINTVSGSPRTVYVGQGINIDSYNDAGTVVNNILENITIINTEDTPILLGSNLTNVTFRNINIQNNGDTKEVHFLSASTDGVASVNIYNTLTDDGKMDYIFQNLGGGYNITINETSAVQHIFNSSNNGFLYLTYPGLKDISIINNSFIVNTYPGGADDIFNTSSGAYTLNTTAPTTFNLVAGDVYRLLSYTFTPGELLNNDVLPDTLGALQDALGWMPIIVIITIGGMLVVAFLALKSGTFSLDSVDFEIIGKVLVLLLAVGLAYVIVMLILRAFAGV